MRRLRSATTHVTGVETAVADGVLVAQPGEEALEAETVASVGRRAISVDRMSVCEEDN